ASVHSNDFFAHLHADGFFPPSHASDTIGDVPDSNQEQPASSKNPYLRRSLEHQKRQSNHAKQVLSSLVHVDAHTQGVHWIRRVKVHRPSCPHRDSGPVRIEGLP